MSEELNLLNILNEERHTLGPMNINLYKNGALFRVKNKNIAWFTNNISSKAKKYFEFSKTFGFKQIIQIPN